MTSNASRRNPPKGRPTAAATGAGPAIDSLLRRRAAAQLHTRVGAPTSHVRRALQSKSSRKQTAATDLLEGRVRLPEKIAAAARAGGNPLFVGMTRAYAEKRGTGQKSKRKTKTESSPPKGVGPHEKPPGANTAAAAASKGDLPRKETQKFHTKRPAASPTGGASTLTLSARFRDIQDARGPAAKAAREDPSEDKYAGEPQRKKPRRDAAGPSSPTVPSSAAAVAKAAPPRRAKKLIRRRCTARVVRDAHRRTTPPARLHSLWAANASALTQLLALGRLPHSERRPSSRFTLLPFRRRRNQRKFLLRRSAAVAAGAIGRRVAAGGSSAGAIAGLAHKAAGADLWETVAEVVHQRRRFVSQLTRDGQWKGRQRLSLARLFPTFGLVVQIISLRLTKPAKLQQQPRRPFAAATGSRLGVVLAESPTVLTVALLPAEGTERSEYRAAASRLFGAPAAGTQQQRTSCVTPPPPLVVRVRKWFPASSGTAAQFLARAAPRRPRATSARRVVAIVCGERPPVPTVTSEAQHPSPLDCLRGRCL